MFTYLLRTHSQRQKLEIGKGEHVLPGIVSTVDGVGSAREQNTVQITEKLNQALSVTVNLNTINEKNIRRGANLARLSLCC
jgi:hypothetical protein